MRGVPTSDALRGLISVERVGSWLLYALFAFSLLLLALILHADWRFAPLVPGVLLGGAVVAALYRHEVAGVIVAIAGYVIVTVPTTGINAAEVLYMLYLFGFLGFWFVTRLLAHSERSIQDVEDVGMLILLVGAILVFPLSFVYGADPGIAVRELAAFLCLAVFFPVKELVRRHGKGLVWAVVLLAWIGAFIGARNGWTYRGALSNAEMAWQIATGRVPINDTVLMVIAVVLFAVMTLVRSRRIVTVAALGFLLSLLGLVLSQSRANWVAFLLGAAMVVLVVPGRHRIRVILIASGGLAAFAAFALLFLGDYVDLVVTGLVERFMTLGTATTRDLSLVNRFYETSTVMQWVRSSPIIGYGFGSPYVFYDLTRMQTEANTFVHNGYVSVWYRLGFWGLGTALLVWIVLALKAFRIVRRATEDQLLERSVAAGGLGALVGLTMSTVTANPYFLIDATMMLGILYGIISGVSRRMSSAPIPS